MATAIVMPRLGMTMKEGTVIEWRAAVGDSVAKGDAILLIESEKAEAEIEAPISGVLRHIYVDPERTVPSGTLLAAMTETADEPFDADAFAAEYLATDDRARGLPGAGAAAAGRTGSSSAPPLSGQAGAGQEKSGAGADAQRRRSQAATGAGDSSATRSTPRASRDQTAGRSVSRSGARAGGRSAAVTPAARRRARELGIDASTLEGSGPGGRVTREDVERAATQDGGRAAIRGSEREGGVAGPMPTDGRRRMKTEADGSVHGEGGAPVAAASSGGVRLIEVAPAVSLEVFESETAGDTVVLVPGLGTDVSAFTGVVPALAERFRVVAVNPRGVGASSFPQSDAHDVETAAADLAAVASGPAHLIGASLGAAVAIETALAHPQVVRSLTLITPFLKVSGRLTAFADGWVRLAAGADHETVAAAILPWMFSASFLADARRRARALRGLTQLAGNVPPETLARQAAGLAAWAGRRTSDLAAIAVPTMIIAAGDDILVGDGREVSDAIPGAERVVIGEAGHAVTVEAPGVVAMLCLSHLLR